MGGLYTEDSPDKRVQVKYPHSGFLARSPEIFKISEIFRVSFPLVPTHKSGQIVSNLNEKIYNYHETGPNKFWILPGSTSSMTSCSIFPQ